MNTLVISCAAAFFVFGLTSSVLGPTVSDLASALGVSIAAIGVMRSGRQLGQFIGFLSFGRAADKYDLRRLALFGAIAMAAGLTLVSSAPFLLAICASVVWGLGHSTYNLAPNVVVGRVYDSRAPAIMTALHGVYGIGAMSGPWLVELLREGGVLLVYGTAATMVLAASSLYYASTKHISGNKPTEQADGDRATGRLDLKSIWPFTLGVLLFNGALFGVADWLFHHAQQATQASSQTAAILTSTFWFALTVGRFLLGGAIARFGERPVMLGSAYCAVIGSAILAAPYASNESVFISAFLLGAGLAVIYPVLIACAANRYPTERGRITGHLAAAGAIGAVVLPALQGWLVTDLGAGMVVIVISTIALAVTISFVPFATKTNGKGSERRDRA